MGSRQERANCLLHKTTQRSEGDGASRQAAGRESHALYKTRDYEVGGEVQAGRRRGRRLD